MQSFADGTDEWRYQLGVAANNGWLAAELARAGSVSAPGALEGKAGLIRAYARREIDAAALTAPLGKTWFIHRVVFKPYPVCAFNQTPVKAALLLREILGGQSVRAIRVRMNPYETGYAGMDSRGPFHSVSGTLMSIPFCIARTLAHGEPALRDMMDYGDAATLALIGRTTLVSDASVGRLCCVIEADLEDGRTLTQALDMTAEDYNYDRAALRGLVERVCAEVGVDRAACAALERFVDDPEGVGLAAVLDTFASLRKPS
ncbi:MmgE/PrpD domain protein [Bordetella hinzii CA90 BAL1384]|uniref:MmgE/PrpD family protein n=1 Tax=Bordetella hinzii TaxID=103855 RepID=UPI00045A8577|nr:MmgE/PrpD family protein [Bordetella hinzii]KCB32256.1 MmgE/PrpD domain protein [Bordetella hinzii CA90 BAL1384]